MLEDPQKISTSIILIFFEKKFKNSFAGSWQIQWNLDLVTLLVSRKTVTKSRVVTKFIAHAYGVLVNSKFHVGTKVTNIFEYTFQIMDSSSLFLQIFLHKFYIYMAFLFYEQL